MPVNDNLRNLWMSFLVPTNPGLLGLNKSQLLKKRVCVKHFDKTQFDEAGVRIRYSYPCLITQMEILHGVPLTTEEYTVENEHNYCQVQMQDDIHTQEDISTNESMQGDDDQSSLIATSQTPQISKLLDSGDAAGDVNKGDENNAMMQLKSKNTPCIKMGKSMKQVATKSHRYIKKCTKIAKESQDDTSSQRLQNIICQKVT
ncbi:hypothetical protein evm_014896 [Chilo suppressalis]|nr:hypothetical protein evm_014896 [Chilo suppressalis]